MAVVRNEKLTEAEIQERIALYAQTRDKSVRDEIVLQYNNLVESIARRFTGAGEPIEDLAQEGYIGLITAVDLFDATKGVKFSTYATHFIIGQIKHYLRDKGKIIKEPAWLQELNQKMTRVIDSLSQKYGRQPSESEIAAIMELPEDMVRDMLMTREVFKVSSLDADRDETNPNAVDPEKIKDHKLVSFQLPMEDKIVLETAMDRLKDIEQRVIQGFYYLDLNQTEIAKKLGISCNYVSHILRNSTKKLKKILMTEEIKDAQIQLAQMSRRINEVRDVNEQISVIDSVTGIYNRGYFLSRLEEEISRAFRYKHQLAVALIEVKMPDEMESLIRMIRFDDVIARAAKAIAVSVRKVDVVSRYSSNVFALILPHTTGESANVVCQRLENVVGEVEVEVGKKSQNLKLELKTGCAGYPEDGSAAAAMVQSAAERAGIDLSLESNSDLPLSRAA